MTGWSLYPEAHYGGFTRHDGTLAFYHRVQALLTPGMTVANVGCGRGVCAEDAARYRAALCDLRGGGRTVIGLDPDAQAAGNPFLDHFFQLRDPAWPLASGSVDLCVADWVLEHVEHPDAFFHECARVLKPGGYFCARTSNAMSLLGFGARMIPNRWHAPLLQKLHNSRQPEDIFPTRYFCNTRSALLRLLRQHGFHHPVIWGHAAEPSYFNAPHFAYLLEWLSLRLMPSAWRNMLLIFAQR